MGLAGIISPQAANDIDASDERHVSERRNMSWRTIFYGFLRSRRHEHRRTTDTDNVYIDWHHPWLFFLGVGVMLFSVADAFLTLQLLNGGAVEANPVMRGLMSWGTSGFVSLKLLMTAFGVFTLVYASRYRMFGKYRVGILITLFFCGYALLICYEILGLIQIADIH